MALILDREFFARAAFVSIDVQEGGPPEPVTEDGVPKLWRSMGFTAADVNAANAFAWNVALPNAVQVAEACRRIPIPLIFVHWGRRFEDGMDLDPEVRKMMIDEHGMDYAKWSGYIGQPGSQPARAFGIRAGDYVLAKTAQDAFASCNIQFVLQNLGAKNLIFVGGHTGACLGKSARSAKRLGYVTVCIEDATTDARESSRRKGIEDSGFDRVMTTAEFLACVTRPSRIPEPSS
jgi:nicotinamidase-related amidase